MTFVRIRHDEAGGTVRMHVIAHAVDLPFGSLFVKFFIALAGPTIHPQPISSNLILLVFEMQLPMNKAISLILSGYQAT